MIPTSDCGSLYPWYHRTPRPKKTKSAVKRYKTRTLRRVDSLQEFSNKTVQIKDIIHDNRKMPSLILFGKRTFLSGDDLRIVAAIAIGYRFLQLGLTSAIVGYILQLLSNGDGWGVRVEWILEKLCIHNGGVRNAALYLPELAYTYAAVSMITSIYGLYFAVRLFRLAGKGTPTDDKERRVPLQRHIQWNLTIGNFLRACSFIFGILTINNMDGKCASDLSRNKRNRQVSPYMQLWTFF